MTQLLHGFVDVQVLEEEGNEGTLDMRDWLKAVVNASESQAILAEVKKEIKEGVIPGCFIEFIDRSMIDFLFSFEVCFLPDPTIPLKR